MGVIFESFSQDFLFLVTAITGYLLVRAYQLATYFQRSGLKRPSHWDMFYLNLKLAAMKMVGSEYIDEMYNRFTDEKAVGIYQFFKPIVLIRDPELVERILIKEFASFHDHGIEADIKANPLEGHLFNMSGGEWRTLRNRLSPVFTSGRLKGMYPLVGEKADKLVRALPRGEEILIRDYLSRFAIDVIGSTAFGIEAGAIEDPDCQFKRMANKIFKPSKKTAYLALMRFFFPKICKLLKLKSTDPELNDFFFSITKQAFDHRTKTGEKRGDFVDLLMQLRGKGKLEFETTAQAEGMEAGSEEIIAELVMTDELLTAQSFIFLAAGWETTSTAMTYTLYYLAKNEEIQDTLRAHLKQKQIHDYESLRESKYLDACITEALRLHPPAGIVFRMCNKDFVVDSNGGLIKKGTMVIVPSYSIQRDAKYYTEPLEFKPERFLEDRQKLHGTYTPFGEGPRICIAERFAKMEVRLAIAKLVENFNIKLSPKTQEPIKISSNPFIIDIKGGLWITLENIKSG